MPESIGIIGASGYIGREVLRVRESGSFVTLGRTPVGGVPFRRCDLGDVFRAQDFAGLSAVIHLASDTGSSNHTSHQEIEFARGLAQDAAERKIRLVYVSSQVASVDAPSSYGRTKALIEHEVLSRGGIVVRPGLVYGGREAALFGQLVQLVRRLPILPRIVPAPLVWPIHVRDLARALVNAAEGGEQGRIYHLAGDPVPFELFLSAIATARIGRRRWFMPVPAFALRVGLRVAAPALGARFSPERFDSLLSVPPRPESDDHSALGISPRPLLDGMSRSGRDTRMQLREAMQLSRAIGFRDPPCRMLKRYTRWLVASGLKAEHLLPRGAWALRARDAGAGESGSLRWRLSLLARLAETETSLVHYFVRDRRASIAALFDVVRVGAIEILVRLIRPFVVAR